MWIREILVVGLLSLLILRFLKLLQTFKKYPPGPSILLLAMKFVKAGFRIPPDIMAEEAKQYGSIYTIWALTMPLIIASGFQAVKELLMKHGEVFSEKGVTPFYRDILQEKGIANSNGHTWKQQRKFGIATLRKLGMGKKHLQRQIEDEAYQLMKTFARSKGQPMDPLLPVSNSISNVVFALLFGYRYSVDDEEFTKLMETAKSIVKFGSSIPYLLYEAAPCIMKHIKWPYKKALANIDFMIQIARKETELHRAQLDVHNPRDYIDYYLLQMEKSKNDSTSTYNEANLFQATSDLIFAGIDTSAAVMTWGLLLMVAYPDIQEKVQKEIEDVFGSSQMITYEDRTKLPYTYAVLHEIMRFKPIFITAPPRQSMQDETILGSFIPKGTLVFPDIRSVLYDPQAWETPQKFNPNHFLDRDGKFVDRKEFVLFSAGPRECMGKDLAKMELFTFFTNLLKAFTFTLPEGVTEADLEPQDGLILFPRPYKLCAVPRSSESLTHVNH